MSLGGKFQLVKSENMLEHMVGNGMPEDQAKKFLDGSATVEISINGNEVKISREKGPAQNLVLNQELTEKGPDGKEFKNTATLNGNELIVTSKGGQGEWKRIYSFSGSDLVVTAVPSKPGVPEGKRFYKKA